MCELPTKRRARPGSIGDVETVLGKGVRSPTGIAEGFENPVTGVGMAVVTFNSPKPSTLSRGLGGWDIWGWVFIPQYNISWEGTEFRGPKRSSGEDWTRLGSSLKFRGREEFGGGEMFRGEGTSELSWTVIHTADTYRQ